ncbi:hypothetical protein [Accumulibacter sp.]|uniref:hypothetical protein n=1 Tax=Accumulibacter sp. TaxID=2053492 RepID=UPI00287AC729|nr:hypothetical protein [Accumulibacter sp.]MDS4055426.1 hypothetical protein [Accumulibacter sp.]HMW80471.1 hypothetical protein [Accumulibacter sp.]HNB66595.1 hypothetical protein [Accumulibacter sp.]HNE40359.1 hypothetical protein [Accumulibacter sp.]HNG16306.1 hypothetical protein [Accumulibacter sp.]
MKYDGLAGLLRRAMRDRSIKPPGASGSRRATSVERRMVKHYFVLRNNAGGVSSAQSY